MKKVLFLLVAASLIGCGKARLKDTETLQLCGPVKSCTITTHTGIEKFGQWVPEGEGEHLLTYTFNNNGYISSIISGKDTITYTYSGDTVIIKTKAFTSKTIYNGENPIATFAYGEKITEFFYKDGKIDKIINGATTIIATHDGDITILKQYSADGRDLKHMRKSHEGKIIGGQGGSLTNTMKYDEKPFDVMRDSIGLPFGTINAKILNIDDIAPQYVWAGLGDEHCQLREYKYTFDEQGNWVTRAQIYMGKCEDVVVRKIVYQ